MHILLSWVSTLRRPVIPSVDDFSPMLAIMQDNGEPTEYICEIIQIRTNSEYEKKKLE